MSHRPEELLAWIGESCRRAANHALRRYAIGATLAFLLLLGGISLAGKAWLSELESGLKGSCDRVNVLRAQSNLSDTVSFMVLSDATKEARRVGREEKADSFALQAGSLTVTELTDCDVAVGNPEDYVTPIAGPIGDPGTGKLSPGVKEIIDASARLIEREAASS